MTKTESAEHLVKTLAIESCEQWLEFHAAGGVRAAIPNTPNLIMVGPADWIAKNVPGVEAMVAAAEPIAHVVDIDRNCNESIINVALEPGTNLYLAATTQASTAQAERSDDATEGLELLDSLIDNIAEDGPYGAEATLTFLSQIRQCFAATSITDSALAAEARNAVLVEAAQAICKALPSEGESIAAESACAAVLALRSATATGSGDE